MIAAGEFRQVDGSGWVRYDVGSLSGGARAYDHVTGPNDSSSHHVTYPTGYDSDCSWCYLGAAHSTAAHVEQLGRIPGNWTNRQVWDSNARAVTL